MDGYEEDAERRLCKMEPERNGNNPLPHSSGQRHHPEAGSPLLTFMLGK